MASNSFGITITPNSSATDLINAITGSGISVVSGSESYTDGAGGLGAGTFTDGIASGIGMESGILLTSGYASSAVGPNDSGSTSGPGLFSKLEFDFVTTTGSLFFNYVFGSEEYLEWVNSAFNDKFELFVNGANVAIVPGTVNTPVEIDTVNATVNPTLFNNNTSGAFNVEYDGFTDVFTASVSGLDTSAVHSMVFHVYDVGDSALDSGVFIQSGTFSGSGVPDSGATLALLGFALITLGSIKRKLA